MTPLLATLVGCTDPPPSAAVLVNADSAWMDAAIQAAVDVGLDARNGGEPWPASDHFPFMARGVPAVWMTRQPDRHYHTVLDTLDQLDLDEALLAVQANAAILDLAAGVAR